MPHQSGKKNGAVYTFAGGAITAIAGIATASTSKPIGVILVVVGAIIVIVVLVLRFAGSSDGQPRRRPVPLAPGKLAAALDDSQRTFFAAALPGVANEVANAAGVPIEHVRANLFTQVPGTNRLGMVADLCFHMNDARERTIQMEIGTGSAGTAFASGNLNRAIWKKGWGANDIGDDAELAKVNPELRWILSAPIYASNGAGAKLVLNVDGVHDTPTAARLADAIAHLPRYATLISQALYL